MLSRVLLACMLAVAFLPGLDAQAAPSGGDPTDKLSCYSDCGGASPRSGTKSCYCDEACNGRGDCCADRNEFCGPSVAKPACSLTTSQDFRNFCGTDLGFVYQHNGVLELLFGDTWEWPGSNHQPPAISDPPGFSFNECFDRGTGFPDPILDGTSDDSRGSMSIMRPPTAAGIPQRAANLPASPTGATCKTSAGPVLTLDWNPSNTSTFRSIKLVDVNGSERRMPPGLTPLAGYSDGTSAYGVFSALDAQRRVSVYIAKRDSASGDYNVVKNLGTSSKFLSPSTTRIASYDPSFPNTRSNFATPTGTGGVLLMYGRPRFLTNGTQTTATNGLYLLKHSPSITTSNWAPEYYMGLSGTGAPIWTPQESMAMPLFTDDFKVTGQIDIKWVPQMGKWVMLYGGDIEWYFVPDANDQPRHGAIHMRLADYPWGPWSRATPLLWREDMGKFIKCDASDRTIPLGCDQRQDPPAVPYAPGDFIAGRPSSTVDQCRVDLPQPVQPNPCPTRHQHGELYAANLIPTWTNPGAVDLASLLKTTTIYFTVSSWMPYQVLIAAADIKLPNNVYNQVKVQLRDLNKRMLTMESTKVTNTAGVTATSWLLSPVVTTDPNILSRGPRIGDTVVFYGQDSAGTSRWIARSGNNIVFPVASGTPPTSAQWKLESVNADNPDETPIVLGKTPFALVSVSAVDPVRRLKSKPEGLRAFDGRGTEAIWTFQNACIDGDVCPQR